MKNGLECYALFQGLREEFEPEGARSVALPVFCAGAHAGSAAANSMPTAEDRTQ
jgi:hypothetical protein